MRQAMMWMWLVGLAACGAAPATGGSLSGTRWVGVVDKSVDANSTPRLEFVGEGRVSGYTGCNMLSGTWSMEGAQVRFGSVATTKRACLGPGGDMEKRLMAVLGGEAKARREGARLVLEGPGGARFEFTEVKG